MELKDKLDELHEEYTTSAYISRFLTNISNPDYARDVRALEQSGTTLEESIKAIRQIQHKLNLEKEKAKVAQIEII